MTKTFLILSKKVGKIRKVFHFKNSIEHKILVTHVISKVSSSVKKLSKWSSEFKISDDLCI